MQVSKDRILTTHVGSLPRSAAVTDVVFAQEKGENPADAGSIIRDAVDAVVLKQVATGVDIVSDGEMSKISYATYIKDRITGFDGDSERDPPSDLEEFPGFLKRQASSGGTPTYRRPCCIGAIEVKDMGPAEVDIQNLLSATQKHSPTQSFMNAASPGVIALFQPNKHYPNHEAYLEALADAMAYELRPYMSRRSTTRWTVSRRRWFACMCAGEITKDHIITMRPWKWFCLLHSRPTWALCCSNRRTQGTRTSGRLLPIRTCQTT